MIFVSFEFLLFLPIVCLLYFLLPYRFRWILLLLSSYFFYSYWNPYYLGIILFSTLVDFLVGIRIEDTPQKSNKKKWLWVSIFLNVGLLCFFKYFNFFSSELIDGLNLFGLELTAAQHNYLLPLGISFYTFQTVSYSIDVYKNRIKAERHLGKYALYVSFFPQLVAGPIERAKKLLSQFHFEYKFDYTRVVEGLQLILWGFFKKLIIADRLGLYVNEVFDNPGVYSGLSIWIASVFFLIQVFCDFSAYSNIAIGIARILGVKLSRNFGNTPYLTVYISSFFRTWHMTLTSWMRDYVFFPLVKKYRSSHVRGLLILFIFLVMGLWHGANWTFIMWGAILGSYIAIEYHTDGWKEAIFSRLNGIGKKALEGVFVVFNLLLISLACLFFRSSSVSAAFGFIVDGFKWSSDIMLIEAKQFYLCIIFWGFLELMHYLMKDKMIHEFLIKKQIAVRWLFYCTIINCILYFRITETPKFIYFEF